MKFLDVPLLRRNSTQIDGVPQYSSFSCRLPYHSLFTGPCGGIAAVIVINSLPRYFPDRAGMATSIYLAGIAFGQILLPSLSRALQTEYGFSGATLILSGLLFNTCACFALLRPLPETGKKQKEKTKSSLKEIFLDILISVWKNMSKIRYPKLSIVSGSMSFMIVGFVNYVSMVPIALLNEGYSRQVASYGLSAVGIGNILTRFVMIVISDKKWLDRRKLFIFGLVCVFICQIGEWVCNRMNDIIFLKIFRNTCRM